MPRISYGPAQKTRVLRILECILRFANDEFELTQKINVQYSWQEDGLKEETLIVKTTINNLKYLCDHYDSRNPLQKADIRDALHCLKDFLGILQDHRVNKQGSQDWYFTLELWSKETDINLKEANSLWEKHKLSRNKKTSVSTKRDDQLKNISQNYIKLPSSKINHLKEFNTDARFNQFPLPFNNEENLIWLEKIYFEEIISMLNITDIFSREVYSKQIKDAENDSSFLAFTKSKESLVCDQEKKLNRTTRLGWNLEQATRLINENPIHIVVSPAHAGTLAILTYLREKNINITFDYHHPHSVEIVENAIYDNFSRQVDGFTLTLATASVLLREKTGRYSSSFMMPNMTHGILSSNIGLNERSLDGEYLLMKEVPSTEFFIYENLINSKLLTKSTTTEMEPDEVTHALSNGDSNIRTIIGFPHYNFNLKFNSCDLLNNPIAQIKPVFLFLRSSIIVRSDIMQALSILIRDAWLSIIENPTILRGVIHQLIRQEDYIETLSRITGISRLTYKKEPFTFEELVKDESLIIKHQVNENSFKKTDVSSILKLRHQVLRNGHPITEVMFNEDHDYQSRHYGAFDRQENNICCVSLIQSYWNGSLAWQLRAMATAPEWRSKGIGRRIIDFMISDLEKDEQLKHIWCNCRVQSSGFYKKMGWREASNQFINGNAGLSVKMVREFFKTSNINNENLHTII